MRNKRVIFGLARHHRPFEHWKTFLKSLFFRPILFQYCWLISAKSVSFVYSVSCNTSAHAIFFFFLKKVQTIDGNCSFIEIERTFGHCSAMIRVHSRGSIVNTSLCVLVFFFSGRIKAIPYYMLCVLFASSFLLSRWGFFFFLSFSFAFIQKNVIVTHWRQFRSYVHNIQIHIRIDKIKSTKLEFEINPKNDATNTNERNL